MLRMYFCETRCTSAGVTAGIDLAPDGHVLFFRYDDRPGICRKFAMGSAYCRDERAVYREQVARGIPLVLRG